MKVDKKKIFLAILMVLLVSLVVYRLQNPFVQKRVEKLTFTGEKENEQKSVILDKMTGSKEKSSSITERFVNKPKASGAAFKDLFAIYQPPVRQEIKTEPRSLSTISESGNETSLEKGKSPLIRAKEYIASYRLYGTYQDPVQKAVFLAKDKLILVAREGDRLDGKYLIDDIQENFITIKALDLNQTIHLDMREFNDE